MTTKTKKEQTSISSERKEEICNHLHKATDEKYGKEGIPVHSTDPDDLYNTILEAGSKIASTEEEITFVQRNAEHAKSLLIEKQGIDEILSALLGFHKN
jgi:hypothetical protein